jgi:L-ascorbate metabolism protein UlaG (beta-lactamase superfamily)
MKSVVFRWWIPVSALALVSGCFGASGYRGPVSDHFDGYRFVNLAPTERRDLSDLLRWQLGRDRGPWDEWRDAQPGPPPPRRVDGDRLLVTWVNHATMLVQTEGVNVLFDPVWSDRLGPVSWAGPSRARPPGLRFEDLPPIDVVLVSHNHYDHMDVESLRRLAREHGPRMYAGLGNAAYLRSVDVLGAADLDWWDSVPLTDDVTIHAVPAQHFSGRGLEDRDRTLWVGFVIDTPHGAIYFAGDTAFGPHFLRVREKFGRVRLALLPIGAYRPRWFMRPVHVDPEEAVQAHRILGAHTSIAMHFGTFPQGDDGQDEPAADLSRALRGNESEHFWILEHGVGREVPPPPGPGVSRAARAVSSALAR